MVRAHSRSPRPEVLVLEGRVLLSTLVAESEPNNRGRTADVIAADDSVRIVGTARAGDHDFFVVPVAGTGQMTISFQGRANLKVDDVATGQALFAGSARAGAHSGTFGVTAGETLLVRVVGAGRGPGAYTLNMAETTPVQGGSSSGSSGSGSSSGSVAASAPNARDSGGAPGDSMATANPISFDASGQARFGGTLSGSSDADFFSFVPPKSGRLTVVPDRNSGPVIIHILDSTGRTRLTLYSDLPNYTASTQVDAGATYYAEVTPRTSAPTSYGVTLTLT